MPGIQPTDVQELIEHGAKTVVLSRGVWERLQVCPETLDILAKNGIKAEVLQTEAAVERFNELREGIPVGGLFHSTC
ncbi:MAG: MTH938/NDUFAF3 family protein [Gammaproteobacteria bacterium]